MSGWSAFDVVATLPSLRRYARALTRDETAADDLVQDALLLAIERNDTFRPGGSLRAWLASIVHNRFISDQRRRRAETQRDAALADVATEQARAGHQESALLLADLAARFAGLPEAQRSALHLVAVEGLSYQETATALGVPIGTIMSRLSRARATLRADESPARTNPFRIVGGRDEL